jgi:glutamine amidotransferase
MCRLVAYLGHDILLDDVLVKPINSLVNQSLLALETNVFTNGDGFGLGWYAPSISDEPALFTAISPAWSDRNLVNLSAKIRAPAFFAHVRAATEGGVSMYNCHPFMYKQWLFMHNGEIGNFIEIKRHLRRLLDDDIYNWIKGETDSEHFFALFLQLAKGRDLTKLDVVAEVLEDTMRKILDLVRRFKPTAVSHFNMVIGDGRRLVASRFCSDPTITPESMHYTTGSRLISRAVDHSGDALLLHQGEQQCILIASEKLSDVASEWHDVRPHHILLVEHDIQIKQRPLNLGLTDSSPPSVKLK